VHSCSKSSISVGKDARMNQSSFCLSCVLQSLLKSPFWSSWHLQLATSLWCLVYFQGCVIAKIYVHQFDVQWKGLNQFRPYWAIGIHLICFLVNFCDSGCLCIEYILTCLCRFCIWNVVVKSIFRSLNKVSDFLNPNSWANQKQSIFFTGPCEDHCIVCVCTYPNPFSCYLKVVLHLKCSSQIILLLWWSCLLELF
jgi:hypothetical protein